jgi:ATP-dependent Clp protease ATP-binding subunit ClpC
VIMTSNIGTRELKDFGQGVGFATKTRQDAANEHAKGVIQKALKRAFAPEFLNRIDDVVLFNTLSREHIHKIIDIELQGLYARVKTLGFEIKLSDEAKDYVLDKGYDIQYGARPLKRAIQKYLEDPMAETIIKSSLVEGDTMVVDFDAEKQEIVVAIQKKKAALPKGKAELPTGKKGKSAKSKELPESEEEKS